MKRCYLVLFWARSTGFEGRHTLSSGMATWLFELLLLLIHCWKSFLHCRHSLSKEGSGTVTIQGRRGRGQSRCSSRSTRRWSPSPGHSQHLGKRGPVSRSWFYLWKQEPCPTREHFRCLKTGQDRAREDKEVGRWRGGRRYTGWGTHHHRSCKQHKGT